MSLLDYIGNTLIWDLPSNFCFYYWFAGSRCPERPRKQILFLGRPTSRIILCTVLTLCVKATAASGPGERQLSCPLFHFPLSIHLPTRGSLQDLPVHVATSKGRGGFWCSGARNFREQHWGTSQCSWTLDLPQTDLLLPGRRQQASDTFLECSYLAGRERPGQTTCPGFRTKDCLTSRRWLPVCSSRERVLSTWCWVGANGLEGAWALAA